MAASFSASIRPERKPVETINKTRVPGARSNAARAFSRASNSFSESSRACCHVAAACARTGALAGLVLRLMPVLRGAALLGVAFPQARASCMAEFRASTLKLLSMRNASYGVIRGHGINPLPESF